MPRGTDSPAPPVPPNAVGQELLAEFIQYGRQRPFEEIVRRYAGMVFNVCYRVTKDKHEAEDATQAVFLTLAVQAKRGAEIKALGPWLQQVAKRLSLDVKRGQKRRKTREEKHHHEQSRRRTAIDEDALPSPDLDELKLILHEELQKLPAKYRLPLILHYFGGMTRDEMAAELNCKASTLGVRIFRGREMLAGRLNGRGVHLSSGAMALAIAYLVKHSVTGTMIARTSHAAAALASGSADLTTVGQLMSSHAGSAEAAARVIALTRRASHVLVIGKVRVTVAIALLAGTSLGAGVKAFALLPQMGMGEVRQMISAGVTRLVRPFVEPLSNPIRIRAEAPPQPHAVAPAAPPVVSTAGVVRPLPTPAPAATAVATAGVAPLPVDTLASVAPSLRAEAQSDSFAATAAPAVAADHPVGAAAPAAPGDGIGPAAASHRSVDTSSARAATPPLLASVGDTATTTGQQLLSGGASAGGAMTASAANDLYVPAGDGSSVYALGGTGASATSAQIVQVPAVGGSVSASNGVVRGYGRIDRTGTLAVSGKVVADGGGVDRTLDLTTFSNVTVATAASGAPAGFYAADHGRLSLPLVGPTAPQAPVTPTASTVGPTASSSASVVGTVTPIAPVSISTDTVLTWGADPSEGVLTPVNSVRLTIHDGPVPTSLSLLATDRNDAPQVPATDGAPIGLWEVGPGAMSDVDLLVRYDDHLVDLLGGDEADVRLWTMGDPSAGWACVTPGSFSLDLADHIVGGSATDVSFFAVTVPPAADVDAGQITAHPAADLAPAPLPAAIGVVPEPSNLGLIALAAAHALGRRRRRVPAGS